MKKVILIGLGVLATLIFLVTAFVTPGWLRSDPVNGCTSKQWTNPSGDLEVFAINDPSPDGLWVCEAQSPEGPFGWKHAEKTSTSSQSEEQAYCALCVEEVQPSNEDSTSWEGDNLGPEKSLPAKISSKFGAIAEIWDGGSYCALVQILPGETWNGSGWKGAYWEGLSLNAVQARFPHHRQEYLEGNSNCHILESASLIP